MNLPSRDAQVARKPVPKKKGKGKTKKQTQKGNKTEPVCDGGRAGGKKKKVCEDAAAQDDGDVLFDRPKKRMRCKKQEVLEAKVEEEAIGSEECNEEDAEKDHAQQEDMEREGEYVEDDDGDDDDEEEDNKDEEEEEKEEKKKLSPKASKSLTAKSSPKIGKEKRSKDFQQLTPQCKGAAKDGQLTCKKSSAAKNDPPSTPQTIKRSVGNQAASEPKQKKQKGSANSSVATKTRKADEVPKAVHSKVKKANVVDQAPSIPDTQPMHPCEVAALAATVAMSASGLEPQGAAMGLEVPSLLRMTDQQISSEILSLQKNMMTLVSMCGQPLGLTMSV
jgi:hypothetical protein